VPSYLIVTATNCQGMIEASFPEAIKENISPGGLVVLIDRYKSYKANQARMNLTSELLLNGQSKQQTFSGSLLSLRASPGQSSEASHPVSHK